MEPVVGWIQFDSSFECFKTEGVNHPQTISVRQSHWPVSVLRVVRTSASAITSGGSCGSARRRDGQKTDTGVAEHEGGVREQPFFLALPVYRLQ